MTTDETRERLIPQWYNPQLKEVLNDLYSRIEELERLQRVKVSRPKLPPPRYFPTAEELARARAYHPLPRSE